MSGLCSPPPLKRLEESMTDWLKKAEETRLAKRAARKATRRADREAEAGGHDDAWRTKRTRRLTRRYTDTEGTDGYYR